MEKWEKPKKKTKRRSLSSLNANAAGIDIGATFHVVAVPPGRSEESVRSFRSFTSDLHALAGWLKALGITTVAMESTGVYWIPAFEILDARGFEVLLINARDVKNVPGRKTDVNDAQWLQQLHEHGLLRGSFRPRDQVVRLHAHLQRHRRQPPSCQREAGRRELQQRHHRHLERRAPACRHRHGQGRQPEGGLHLLHGDSDDAEVCLRRVRLRQRFYPLTDALGSVVALTDSAGAIVREYAYAAYGQRTTDGGGTNLNFGFTGREHDSSGLRYHRDRYVDALAGRWNQPDRIGMGDGPNLYRYARANPIQLVDPLGFKPGDVFRHAEDATIDALIWSKSRSDSFKGTPKVEYGAAIYKVACGFTYENPRTDSSPGFVDPDNAPSGADIVSFVHVHPDARAFGYPFPEQFTDEDKK
ncbi:MAG: RHS repeat-associated core domain-containing protein [Myxococcaceae bacterium]